MKIKNKFIYFLIIIVLVTLLVSGTYLYSTKNAKNEISDTRSSINPTLINKSPETPLNVQTKKFELYRKVNGYVYLVSLENTATSYYRSDEIDKFKNFNETDDIQITASSYTQLSVPEKFYIGIKDYSVDVTMQISDITEIKVIIEPKPL